MAIILKRDHINKSRALGKLNCIHWWHNSHTRACSVGRKKVMKPMYYIIAPSSYAGAKHEKHTCFIQIH